MRHAIFLFFAAVPILAQSSHSPIITSAVSYQHGLPAKGSIATAFCTGLHVDGAASAAGYPLPLALAGISVTVGGAVAPLFGVADRGNYQQINFQVPQEAVVNADGKWSVKIVQNEIELSAQVASYESPGEFFRLGCCAGVFQHASDFSLVTAQNPAHAGEVLIGYLTGLPSAAPMIPTGEAAPMSPLSAVPQRWGPGFYDLFAILLNGAVVANSCSGFGSECVATNILYLGLTPGSAGVYQLNFVVPESTQPGNLLVQLERSRCAKIFGTPCGVGGFLPNLRAGCFPSSNAFQFTCASEQVLLPVR